MIALERRFPYEQQPFLRREFWTDLLWFSTVFSVLMGFLAAKFVIPGIGRVVKAHRKARMGRNPQTGEAIKIKAKTVVRLRPAKVLKDAVLK